MEYTGCPLFTETLTSAHQVLCLATTWPALAKLTNCQLSFDEFYPFPPISFPALRELHVDIDRCNPSYIALIGNLHGLETLVLTDHCHVGQDEEKENTSVYWRTDAYPTFTTSLWAAIAGLPRLAELRLTTYLPEMQPTLAAYLDAPEGSFPSLQRVLLDVAACTNNGLSGLVLAPREAGRFVRQFPHLEHLDIRNCDDWPEGMGGHPWSQLKTLELSQRDIGRSSSQLPSSIRDMTHLQTLVISGAYGISSLPEWFGELAQLTRLQITGSHIEALPQSMSNLQHLTSLDLSSFEFSELPSVVCRLTALVDLKLDRCDALTAALPPSIAALTRLTSLSINEKEVGFCYRKTSFTIKYRKHNCCILYVALLR